MKSSWTESIANVITLAAWVAKGIWILAEELATKGVVEEPIATLTKGSLESLVI